MKVFICYEFEENHGGGGTSVLENLRNYFIENELYTSSPKDADIILFNSFHSIQNIINLKQKFPKALFIHRIDGPMGVYNTPTDLRDEYVFLLNKYLADATIFQTQWSKKACQIIGLKTEAQPTVTIPNAPDSSIFYPVERHYSSEEKFVIFYSSWSTNINKGFDTLNWIDKNLDFSKYKFIFAGRAEKKFQNIKKVGKLNKQEIAKQLESSHAFLFASKFDPCSNSLAEAIATGIPVICFDGGGSPELLTNKTYTYQQNEEISNLLDNLRNNYPDVVQRFTPTYTFKMMTYAYTQFLENCLNSNIRRKPFTFRQFLKLKLKITMIKLLSKHNLLSKTYGLITGKYQKKRDIQLDNRKILNEQR